MKERQLFLIKPDFLPEPDHRAILDHVLAHEADCEPTAVRGGEISHFRSSMELKRPGPCRQIVHDALRPLVPELCAAFGVQPIPHPKFDGSVVAHTDGSFYKPHVDQGKADIYRSRTLSAVYYFCESPARFEGGELRMFRMDQPGAYIDIPILDNQLVVFPSMIPHEVRPVRVPSGRFEDARFAVNVWVHRVPQEDQS